MEVVEERRRVCVTGAGGFVASWLVKLLLSKGYEVHGTARDPSNEKNAHLKKFEKASENLKLFKTDLLDNNGLSAAITGCDGVFHVASPLPVTKVADPELELITPAVTGTLNVLKACSKANVKRVVVVSSTAAVEWNPNWPQGKAMDEDCWSDKDFLKKIEAMDEDSWSDKDVYENIENWYSLSKTMAEEAAWEYAQSNGLDVITVCPSLVLGPLLQPTLNGSSMFLFGVIKGLVAMEDKVWYFVDVRDVADALLLVYQTPGASGRYICAPHPSYLRDLVDLLKSIYPNYSYHNYSGANQDVSMSSEKLKNLGWKCRTLKETLIDSVDSYQEIGVLERN